MNSHAPTATTVPRTAERAVPHPPTEARNRARYVGVDIARLLAVLGMMAAHLVAVNAGSPGAPEFDILAAEIADALTTGIAAPLFAVLGGISAVFATRRALSTGRVGAAIASVALRGVILVLLGLALGYIESPIVVVLVYYGIAMILVAPLIAARSWVLGAVALVAGIAGGPLNALLRDSLDIVEEAGSPSFLTLWAEPVETLRGVLVTGMYPAITWAVYLLIGALVARALIAASGRGTLARTSCALAAAGAAAAIAASLVSNWTLANLAAFGVSAPEGLDEATFTAFLGAQHFGAPNSPELWSQLIAAPHSGSPTDILRTAGIALAVIGLLVAIFDANGRRTGRLTEVFRAAGAAPLTIYTLHIIATGLIYTAVLQDEAVLASGMLPWWVAGIWALGIQFAGVLLIGIILSATGKRGPLEALTSGIVRGITRT